MAQPASTLQREDTLPNILLGLFLHTGLYLPDSQERSPTVFASIARAFIRNEVMDIEEQLDCGCYGGGDGCLFVSFELKNNKKLGVAQLLGENGSRLCMESRRKDEYNLKTLWEKRFGAPSQLRNTARNISSRLCPRENWRCLVEAHNLLFLRSKSAGS